MTGGIFQVKTILPAGLDGGGFPGIVWILDYFRNRQSAAGAEYPMNLPEGAGLIGYLGEDRHHINQVDGFVIKRQFIGDSPLYLNILDIPELGPG